MQLNLKQQEELYIKLRDRGLSHEKAMATIIMLNRDAFDKAQLPNDRYREPISSTNSTFLDNYLPITPTDTQEFNLF